MIEKLRAWSKKLYAQTQLWGKSENCIRDLIALTVISCVIIPIPVEALLIAIITAAPRRWLRATFAIILGSVIGALIWYVTGRMMLGHAVKLLSVIAPGSNWLEIKAEINSGGLLFLAVASFTPGLFRIGMLAAGVIGVNPLGFVVSITAGRAVRFFLEAGLLRLFGEKLRSFLEKYFDLLSIGMGAIAFIVLIMIKLVK